MKYTKKFPPYGRPLSERLKFGNHPDYVFVCAGLNAWPRARQHNQNPDHAAVVLPNPHPERYRWPVQGCRTILEWSDGPSEQVLNRLLGLLIEANCSQLASYYVGSRAEEPDCFDLKAGKWVDGFPHVQIFPVKRDRHDAAA